MTAAATAIAACTSACGPVRSAAGSSVCTVTYSAGYGYGYGYGYYGGCRYPTVTYSPCCYDGYVGGMTVQGTVQPGAANGVGATAKPAETPTPATKPTPAVKPSTTLPPPPDDDMPPRRSPA